MNCGTDYKRRHGRMAPRIAGLVLMVACFFSGLQTVRALQSVPGGSGPGNTDRTATVGYPCTYLELVLPAPEVVPLQLPDRSQPVTVRIDRVSKHGSDFRYDLQVTGLEAGKFNVSDFLVTGDGQPHPGLPPIWLEVQSLLPPGQVEPHPTTAVETGRGGYYLPALVAGGVIWLTGLMSILFTRRFRTLRPGSSRSTLTLAERIRPMLVRASLGNLDSATAAGLERTLTSFWRRRLRLEHLSPEVLISTLRKHEEAGPLLNQLEAWLHRPEPDEVPDLEQLLRPYQEYSDLGI